jgi:ABC-type phosphate transport system substrate-binding protein
MFVGNRVKSRLVGLALSLCANAAAADVVAVVSAKNPATTLSKNQVMDIFLGKASRFPDGSQAVPIDQAEGSAVRDEFYLTFAGKVPSQLKAYWSKVIFTGRGEPPKELANSVDVKKRLIKDPNAIGYIERSVVDASVKIVLAQ